MGALLVVVALITLTVGCGSSTNPSQRGVSDPGTIEALWKKSGESVALVPGTSDYSPGDVRVSFLVVNSQARVIAPPRADVWIARAMKSRPFAHTIATRERVGAPGIPEVGAPNVSRTCGPAVDVVDYVRRRFAGTPIRFIHVEVYKGNNPRNGWSQWMRQWQLTTEPWTFLVGRNGRIKAKFEGALSAPELESAVNRFLR
jgi:hypothetical protein